MNVNDNVELEAALLEHPLNPVRPVKFRPFVGGAGKFGEPIVLKDAINEAPLDKGSAPAPWRWANAALI